MAKVKAESGLFFDLPLPQKIPQSWIKPQPLRLELRAKCILNGFNSMMLSAVFVDFCHALVIIFSMRPI